MDIFAEMESNGIANCAMEASSHAIYQNRTAGTNFTGGAFTNLSEDHLDYHKTMEAYFAAKRLFFERLAVDKPGSPAQCGHLRIYRPARRGLRRLRIPAKSARGALQRAERARGGRACTRGGSLG